jgi:mycothiol system anti-sigma-R factor
MSRDCEQALANLYSYLDSELEPESSARVKAHLEACDGCDAPFDFELRLRQVIRGRLGEELPEVVLVRLRAMLAVETAAG